MHARTNLPIAIYEKEPTSIIAYALSSRDYEAKLQLLADKNSAAKNPPAPAVLGVGVAEGPPGWYVFVLVFAGES